MTGACAYETSQKTWTLHTLRSLKYLHTLELDFFVQSLGMSTILPIKCIKFCAARLWLYATHLLLAAHRYFFFVVVVVFLMSLSLNKKRRTNKKFITFLSTMFSSLWHWHHTLWGKLFVFIYMGWCADLLSGRCPSGWICCSFVFEFVCVISFLFRFFWPNISSQFYFASFQIGITSRILIESTQAQRHRFICAHKNHIITISNSHHLHLVC